MRDGYERCDVVLDAQLNLPPDVNFIVGRSALKGGGGQSRLIAAPKNVVTTAIATTTTATGTGVLIST